MDDFKSNKNREKLIDLFEDEEDDAYLKDINQKMETKRLRNIIGSNLLERRSDNKSDFQRKKELAFNRSMEALKIWALGFVVLTNTFLIYPSSVKFVKRIFKLEGFWNIHFAICPILFNWNAITLGIFKGTYDGISYRSVLLERYSTT